MVPLKKVLESHFGGDFPVGAGTTKRDDPLVITDERDYVSIEYAVARFLLEKMGFEYEFEQQRTHNQDGRVIDELVYAAKESGEVDWSQTRRFFFDVTAGSHGDEEAPSIEELRRQIDAAKSAIPESTHEYFRKQKELALADVDSDVKLTKLLRLTMVVGVVAFVGFAITGHLGWVLAIALCVALILAIQFILRPILFAIKKRKFRSAMAKLSDEHYGH